MVRADMQPGIMNLNSHTRIGPTLWYCWLFESGALRPLPITARQTIKAYVRDGKRKMCLRAGLNSLGPIAQNKSSVSKPQCPSLSTILPELQVERNAATLKIHEPATLFYSTMVSI